MTYASHMNMGRTPQSEKIPGSTQVANAAGGFGWQKDDWSRLDEFLILGCEGGTYYAEERPMTLENADVVLRCLKSDGARVVKRTVEISQSGRAPKNDPALFVLALGVKFGDESTRRDAYAALPLVARIGTFHFSFQKSLDELGVGWGRGRRRASGNWYTERSAESLAYQLAKYQSRNGYANRDLLRLAHPKAPTPAHQALFKWAVDDGLSEGIPQLIEDMVRMKKAESVDQVVRVLSENPKLTWEMVPTEHLAHAKVWEALLPNLKMGALIRNMGRMTANGLIAPMSNAARVVAERLVDGEALREERVHPIAALQALGIYSQGHGEKGKLNWTPAREVIDGLDRAFYLCFGNVEASGKRILICIDVSGSMHGGEVAGLPGITPAKGAVAMGLVTANAEKQWTMIGYTTRVQPFTFSPRERMDDVLRKMPRVGEGTDCAQPMIWALENKVPVDVFLQLTDSQTWQGGIHPAQALREYRQKMGIPAKMVVVGMTAAGTSVGDPDDAGTLDVVGFDTNAPNLIADFAK